MRPRREFYCLDCKVDTGKISEHYMLIDKIWYKIHNSNIGMLCIGCVEQRLGRLLTQEDFKVCYLNKPSTAPMSTRLASRMGLV